jgi:hypothetical protein
MHDEVTLVRRERLVDPLEVLDELVADPDVAQVGDRVSLHSLCHGSSLDHGENSHDYL